MDARDEVIRVTGLNDKSSRYYELVKALDAYRNYVRAETLQEAEKDLSELRALYQAGVDNWSGYDYAMEIHHNR